MKKTFSLFVALFVAMSINAQTADYKQLAKERKQQVRYTQAQIDAKVSKTVRREAKTYRKEGWLVTPGALPLDKQLERSYQLQYETDDNLMPKYIMGEGRSIGETYDAAKMQAMEMARLNLVAQIESEMKEVISNAVANKQLPEEDAASITQTITRSTTAISQRLSRILPVMELYNTKPNKNKEVLIRIAYSSEQARATVKNAIREDLERQADGLGSKLDDIDW